MNRFLPSSSKMKGSFTSQRTSFKTLVPMSTHHQHSLQECLCNQELMNQRTEAEMHVMSSTDDDPKIMRCFSNQTSCLELLFLNIGFDFVMSRESTTLPLISQLLQFSKSRLLCDKRFDKIGKIFSAKSNSDGFAVEATTKLSSMSDLQTFRNGMLGLSFNNFLDMQSLVLLPQSGHSLCSQS